MPQVKYQIEKGIPIKGPLYNMVHKYPFRFMEVGDSFTFEAEELKRVRHAAHTAGARQGKSFVVSPVQLRCWRRA